MDETRYHYQNILCVGGPFAGRVVKGGIEMFRFPRMSAARILRQAYTDVPLDMMEMEVELYRKHVAQCRCGGYGVIEAACLVHESMSDREADCAAIAAMMTMLVTGGLDGD